MLTLIITIAVAAMSGIGIMLLLIARPQETPPEDAHDPRHASSGGPGRNRIESSYGDQAKSKPTNGEKTQTRLIHAGFYGRQWMTWFYISQFMLASIPILLGFMLFSMGIMSLKVAIVAALFVAISGVVLPGLILDYVKAVRQTNMRRSLPDALDVIVVCVEAGLTLNAAIVRVAKELGTANQNMAIEFRIVHREVQMGNPMGEALRHFADRYDLDELRSLASVVKQAERFGTSIATALRVHGESLRIERKIRAQTKAQKAGVKLLLPTVFCIFPALLVVILGPAAFDIYDVFSQLR